MKNKRQKRILELIENNIINKQDEIVSLLIDDGFDATQATVSRDIKELGITKISLDGKTLRYVSPKTSDNFVNNRMILTLKNGFVSMTMAGNILVVKTAVGMAMAVAAVIDAMHYPEIAGCIAGDDTIFCAVNSINDGEKVISRINEELSK